MIHTPIETERLRIRRFEPRDLEAYLSFMLDEESTRFLLLDASVKSEAGARSLFEHVVESYDSRNIVHAYAIIDKTADTYVGSCGFTPYREGVVECYYCVNREHRGRGIATEATRALIAALARETEIRAYCHSENAAAHAVAKKCGMVHKGVGRNPNTGIECEFFVYPADGSTRQ